MRKPAPRGHQGELTPSRLGRGGRQERSEAPEAVARNSASSRQIAQLAESQHPQTVPSRTDPAHPEWREAESQQWIPESLAQPRRSGALALRNPGQIRPRLRVRRRSTADHHQARERPPSSRLDLSLLEGPRRCRSRSHPTRSRGHRPVAVTRRAIRHRSRRRLCGGSSGTTARPWDPADPGIGCRRGPSRRGFRSATSAGRSTADRSSCLATA